MLCTNRTPTTPANTRTMSIPRVSFFTKGQTTAWNDSHIVTDQCYVQYTAPQGTNPQRELQSVPLLFIHGGGLTGAQWESTPDRRPGWAILASRAGRHVYTMDGVDHGRSLRAPDAFREGEVEYRTAKQVWQYFRLGRPEDWESKMLYEKSQFPTQYLDAFVEMQAARRRTTDQVEMRGIIDVVTELAVDGPIDVVAHSNGAMLLCKALRDVGHLVRKAVLVEPGPKSEADDLDGREVSQTLVVWGSFIAGHNLWEPLKKKMEGANAVVLDLPELAGFAGNSHFPMCDHNSAEVWNEIAAWLNMMA